mmetsp:Transcript_43286/g.71521  ORF Transcript_43286/g.71521 Transcript_43286/m.71521 type:complete len:236 (+) Transcript_43286:57-764(+)
MFLLYDILAFLNVAAVNGPFDVLKGRPSKHAIPLSLILSLSLISFQGLPFLSILTRLVGLYCVKSSSSKLTRSPITASFGGLTISSFDLSSLDAAKSIPALSTPLSFAGFRFENTKHITPLISSMLTLPLMPEQIWRGFSSPISIISTYILSASGCSEISTTLPTTNTHLPIAGRLLSLADGCCFCFCFFCFCFCFPFCCCCSGFSDCICCCFCGLCDCLGLGSDLSDLDDDAPF